MSGCSLRSRRGVMSFRIGSDGVRGDGEEGSRGLVLGCSNRRLPEGQAGGECVRRGVFGAARRYSNPEVESYPVPVYPNTPIYPMRSKGATFPP